MPRWLTKARSVAMAQENKELRCYATQIARQATVPAGSNDLIACALAAASVNPAARKEMSSDKLPQKPTAPARERKGFRERIIWLLRTSVGRLRR